MKLLEGIRVVNLAVNLPGPVAARRLHQMGASVVKVEPPAGDPMESYSKTWYADMAAGHTVVQVDLKDPAGLARLHAYLSEADLLITASRPAALERLGLGWKALHERHPALCQVAIVGYPSPRQNEAGHDLTYQASLGLLTPPHMPRTLLADMAGGEQTVEGALALLLGRHRGLGSGYCEVALSSAAEAMAEPLRYGCTVPGANLGGGCPEYNIYPAQDGWVAVAALEPHFKKRLEESLVVGTDEEYRAVFASRGAVEWQQWGQELDVPIVALR
ncbi:MAG TPA: carnitine dehydratase [Geobacter sp.]|nr:carnitine dehydratase [Geobacter sp.]